jgi:hypothetical protein
MQPVHRIPHPALFACTLTEHDTIVRGWVKIGCRPVSTWITASTWRWANTNLDAVPHYQGGGQWHEQFSYLDRYFEKGPFPQEMSLKATKASVVEAQFLYTSLTKTF